MKRLLLSALVFLLFFGGTTTMYQLPRYVVNQNDSIPTIDQFGRIRNGIIAQGIITTLNADPGGVKLTRSELDYIRAIVGGLYTCGYWQKTKAIYGLVGGTEYKHKFNWKDPRDLDAAYRLSFLGGGWVHSATGAKPNGSSSYADTFMLPSQTTANSIHMAYYQRNGFNDAILISSQLCRIENFGGSVYSSIYDTGTGRTSAPVSSAKGLLIGSRLSTTSHAIYKSGNLLNSNSTVGGYAAWLAAGYTFYLAASHSVTITQFSNSECGFASIGDGLTDKEAVLGSQAVLFSQGILNRK